MVPGIWMMLGQLLKYGISMVWLSPHPSHGNSTMASSTFATYYLDLLCDWWKFEVGFFSVSDLQSSKPWMRTIHTQKHDGHHMKDGFLVMSHVSFPKAPILTGTLRENQALVVGMLQRIFQLLQATSGNPTGSWLDEEANYIKPGKTEANSPLQVLTSSVQICGTDESASFI